MKDQINKLIAERQTYGVRVQVTLKSGYVLIWSNAYEKWHRSYLIKKGEALRLDANQIFIPGKARDIDAVLPELMPLPLYSNSFEALERRAG